MAARCCGAGSGRARRLWPGSGDADGEAAWTAPAGLVKHELTASNEQINKTFAVNTRDNFLPLIRPRVALPAKWGCAPSADGRLGGGHPGRGHRGERPASWLFTSEERPPPHERARALHKAQSEVLGAGRGFPGPMPIRRALGTVTPGSPVEEAPPSQQVREGHGEG